MVENVMSTAGSHLWRQKKEKDYRTNPSDKFSPFDFETQCGKSGDGGLRDAVIVVIEYIRLIIDIDDLKVWLDSDVVSGCFILQCHIQSMIPGKSNGIPVAWHGDKIGQGFLWVMWRIISSRTDHPARTSIIWIRHKPKRSPARRTQDSRDV